MISVTTDHQRPDDTGVRLSVIDIETVNYLKTLRAISKLSLPKMHFTAQDAEYCAEAFNKTHIDELYLLSTQVSLRKDSIAHFLQAFKNSQLGALTVWAGPLNKNKRWHELPYILRFVRDLKLIRLNISQSDVEFKNLEDEFVFAKLMRFCRLLYMRFFSCYLGTNVVTCLSKNLAHSTIVHLELQNCYISSWECQYLAHHLPGSQVTRIDLRGNHIGTEDYLAFLAVLDNTNLKVIEYDWPEQVEGVLTRDNKLILPRKTTSVADKISKIFNRLVAVDFVSDNFEFVLLTYEDKLHEGESKIDIQDYAFLLNALNGKQRVHILCEKSYGCNCFDFEMIDKVNNFIAGMQDKFCKFFDNNLVKLIEYFGTCTLDYVHLVKAFEGYRLYVIAKNLLYHRALYFVDDNGEFLHPYIYKLMHKYGMPMYGEMEPSKRQKIISYFQNNDEFDDAQEVIHLLENIQS